MSWLSPGVAKILYFAGTDAAEIGKEDLSLLVKNASGAFKGHLYM